VFDEGGAELRLHDVRRRRKRACGVAAPHPAFDEPVARAVVEEERRPRRLRRLGRVECGTRGPCHREVVRPVVRPVVLEGHERHGLSPEPHVTFGQRGLVDEGGDGPEGVAPGDVRRRQHRGNVAARGRPSGEVAEGEGRMGVRRADGVEHHAAGPPDVRAEEVARDLGRAVEPFDPAPHGSPRLRRGGGPGLPPRVADRGDDLPVARAAAEDAAERRLGLGLGRARVSSRSAVAATSIPGVQMPHCAAPCRRNAASSRAWPARAPSPSTVVTSRPATRATGVRQAQTGSPPTSTVQAPQSPASQPTLVPVRPSVSRSTSESRRVGSPSGSTTAAPFSVNPNVGACRFMR
jgi:hypothetical protein